MKSVRIVCLGVMILVVAAAASGCASDDGSPATRTTAATTLATGTSQPAVTLPDGTQFGFVRRVADGTLSFDPAEFLDEEAGLAVARADGAIGPNEDLPDPFYIHNPAVEDLRLQVDPSAQFHLLAYDSTGTPLLEKTLSYEELAHLWATGDDKELMSAGFGSYDDGLPMYLTVSGGRVTGGREQYVP
jgi:hypothetical protein